MRTSPAHLPLPTNHSSPVVVHVDGDHLSLEVIGVDWGTGFAPYCSNTQCNAAHLMAQKIAARNQSIRDGVAAAGLAGLAQEGLNAVHHLLSSGE